MLYIVVKEVIFNLRVTEDLREDFRVVAMLRGATMSSLLHQYMVKAVREEKNQAPEEFEAARQKLATRSKFQLGNARATEPNKRTKKAS